MSCYQDKVTELIKLSGGTFPMNKVMGLIASCKHETETNRITAFKAAETPEMMEFETIIEFLENGERGNTSTSSPYYKAYRFLSDDTRFPETVEQCQRIYSALKSKERDDFAWVSFLTKKSDVETSKKVLKEYILGKISDTPEFSKYLFNIKESLPKKEITSLNIENMKQLYDRLLFNNEQMNKDDVLKITQDNLGQSEYIGRQIGYAAEGGLDESWITKPMNNGKLQLAVESLLYSPKSFRPQLMLSLYEALLRTNWENIPEPQKELIQHIIDNLLVNSGIDNFKLYDFDDVVDMYQRLPSSEDDLMAYYKQKLCNFSEINNKNRSEYPETEFARFLSSRYPKDKEQRYAHLRKMINDSTETRAWINKMKDDNSYSSREKRMLMGMMPYLFSPTELRKAGLEKVAIDIENSHSSPIYDMQGFSTEMSHSRHLPIEESSLRNLMKRLRTKINDSEQFSKIIPSKIDLSLSNQNILTRHRFSKILDEFKENNLITTDAYRNVKKSLKSYASVIIFDEHELVQSFSNPPFVYHSDGKNIVLSNGEDGSSTVYDSEKFRNFLTTQVQEKMETADSIDDLKDIIYNCLDNSEIQHIRGFK